MDASFVSDMKPMDWIVVCVALAACAGVGVLFFQLRELTRQIKLQHFADYTTRHQRIVSGLPDDINAPGCTLADRPDYERTLQRMRAYFDLSFEKWYLNRKHQIDPDIWCIWKDGITRALSKPAPGPCRSPPSSRPGGSSNAKPSSARISRGSWISASTTRRAGWLHDGGGIGSPG